MGGREIRFRNLSFYEYIIIYKKYPMSARFLLEIKTGFHNKTVCYKKVILGISKQ
jgi:hypothetical protein